MDNQFGDLIAVDVSDFNVPAAGVLEQPQISSQLGGATLVSGVTSAGGPLLYIGGSTSVGPANNGVGRLQTVDAANPASMQIVSQVLVPGTIQFGAPLIQGTVGVGIGNTGGYVPGSAQTMGNIVVARDLAATNVRLRFIRDDYQLFGGAGRRRGSDWRQCFCLCGSPGCEWKSGASNCRCYQPGGSGHSKYSTPQPFNSMQVVGNTLYATLGRMASQFTRFRALRLPNLCALRLRTPCWLSIKEPLFPLRRCMPPRRHSNRSWVICNCPPTWWESNRSRKRRPSNKR